MTNLVASLIVKNELGRYLEPCIDHLLDFCDEIRVLNDGSTDGSDKWLVERSDRINVADLAETTFFDHEGRARQVLLDWTHHAQPTHILAIDADEFFSSPQEVRRAVDEDTVSNVWTCCMREVWNASEDALELRQDGGWEEHDVTMLWRVNAFPRSTILDRALACGRIPQEARYRQATCVYSACLHFGWANKDAREQRHERYALADGGRYHAGSHLDSILWNDDACRLTSIEWPDELVGRRDAILAAASGTTERASHGN